MNICNSLIAVTLSLVAFGATAQSSPPSIRYDTPLLEYPLVNGLYFDVDMPGSGYMIDNHPRPTKGAYYFFTTVYSYDASGLAKWYNLSGEWTPATPAQIVQQQYYGSATADFRLANGGNCYGCPFLPNTNPLDPTLGSATLVQRGAYNVDVEWQGTTTRIQRQNLNPEQLVGNWRGTIQYRIAGGGVYVTPRFTVNVRRRADTNKVRFWSDEGFPIPAPTDIQFEAGCVGSPSEPNCGIGASLLINLPPGSLTTMWHSAADGEFRGLTPCIEARCMNQEGLFKPSATGSSPFGDAVIYRLYMPNRNSLHVMIVRGAIGAEKIVSEESYTRIP